MTYATLMVHLQPGRPNAGILAIAGDLAERLHAGVIGIAACQPIQIMEGNGYLPTNLLQADRDEIEKEIGKTEVEFRSAFQKHVRPVEWRSAITAGLPVDYIAHEARCADLIITNADWQHGRISDLVMQLGRPALVIPTTIHTLNLNHVLVGWKDTREARRATLDALPILKRATRVTVVEIADEKDSSAGRTHLEDVASWLKSHGVSAEQFVSPSSGNDAMRLNTIAQGQGVDLIVAGAYGHSRLREFVLGGVTHDLLLCANRCSFVSH
jgi:nucleotide-binding universal stress UspA family protein